MGTESIPTTSPTPKFNSLESLKGVYQQGLENILESQLTIDNVDTFADEALDKTINLIGEVMNEYRRNPNVKARPTTLPERDQEDEAFKILELPNIHEVLDRINDVISEIDNIKKYLNQKVQRVNRIITPTQAGSPNHVRNGEGAFNKKIFNRLLALLYILEHDFSLPPENTRIIESAVTPDTIRRTPYVRIEIPDKERVVYICDEENNASYVFDTKKMSELGLTLDEMDVADKEKKNDFITTNIGLGIRMIQSPNWRIRMAQAIEKQIPEREISEIVIRSGEAKVSEFRERKVWPPYSEFQAEVVSHFRDQKDIGVWYAEERKRHLNWPSSPHATYKGKGWQSWPKLVEKRLPFETFQAEVRGLYKKSGESNAHKWYMREYKNHPKWPSDPYMFYSDEEWISWSDLVGQENIHGREFLPFDQFQVEVRALYPGHGNVQKWYKKVRVENKKTNIWPSIPHWLYRDTGWTGWAELVGKENHMKREFLPYEQLQAEVTALHPNPVGLRGWYREEKKKHKNWPNNIEKQYNGKGWVGWAELVGEETPPKKELLSFNDFQQEVKGLYPGGKGITTWYDEEQSKHPNWPFNPHTVYKNRGWVNWADLIKD